jgi:hypothetical protein
VRGALRLASRGATGAADVWRRAAENDGRRQGRLELGRPKLLARWRGHGHPRRPVAAAGTHRRTTSGRSDAGEEAAGPSEERDLVRDMESRSLLIQSTTARHF